MLKAFNYEIFDTCNYYYNFNNLRVKSQKKRLVKKILWIFSRCYFPHKSPRFLIYNEKISYVY